ncbi:MAG: proteasome accessory factor [Nocardioidaceae bacterium]|nr:proteasome accessory factor [Nocardioidaceae bacterium]
MSAAGSGTARDQVTRLLALVPYLQGRGEVPVEEVAREFGVSPRTIRRDVNVLLFCGLPGLGMGDLIDIDFDALEGEDVIRLSNADYLTRPLRLDSTEAAALVAGLRALLEGSQGPEREVVERTLRKVEEAAGEAAGIAAQVELLPEDTREQDLRERLSGAVADRRQVRLTHESATRDEVTSRIVDPVALSTVEGHTYLDAWCHLVEDRRLFRLDRITDAEVLDAGVSEHAALRPLDLREGTFRPAPDALLATVRLSPAARWVGEYYPVDSAHEEPDGGMTIQLRVADPGWLVRLMLRLGGEATLVAPPDLADQVRRTARAALGAYH